MWLLLSAYLMSITFHNFTCFMYPINFLLSYVRLPWITALCSFCRHNLFLFHFFIFWPLLSTIFTSLLFHQLLLPLSLLFIIILPTSFSQFHFFCTIFSQFLYLTNFFLPFLLCSIFHQLLFPTFTF